MFFYILTFIVIFLTPGCGRVDFSNELACLKKKTFTRTGLELEYSWPPNLNNLCNISIDPNILEIIKKPITRNDAVRIALLNNKNLQVVLDDLGIAKADLVQAGLLQNPGLAGIFSLPIGNIKEATITEVVALFAISDLWQVPLKINVSQNDLEMASLNILGTILNTITQTRIAYDTLLYKTELLNLTKQLLNQVDKTFFYLSNNLRQELQKEYDAFLYEIELQHYKLEKSNLEDDINIACVELVNMLGLPLIYTKQIRLADKFNCLNFKLPSFRTLLEWAYINKPELQISLFKIEKYKQQIRLEKSKLFDNVLFGIGYQTQAIGSSNTTTEPFLGPAFDMKVPLFDQNQAQIAKAELMFTKAQKELDAQKLQLERDVYKEFYSVKGYKEQAKTYHSILKSLIAKKLALKDKIIAKSDQLSSSIILQTEKALYDVNVKLLQSHFEILNSVSNLERAIGRRIDF